ncbi:MOSC domain-containing protein [Nostoc sp. FACHB-152]|uniref:MOSC domain-containing protein n=1 Tax=unclassified Nostoc TaxID=2593658 RepID=UPI0016843BEB|nr:MULTISPECIES: MOSC domain-containing protein [unclassified Nostoc]MBD2451266.1 MOSC domain-containing protein [Nostoc sp. FACHB-152]MBD2472439.1 MOSC domain-containing protein [Nostoc sp. FACHB-145]
MKQVEEFSLIKGHGIEGDINANPISPRQVLVVRDEDISDLGIPPGELRENILISGIQPENFTPGSLVSFDSGAAIRLTFHCEPCKRIAHLVDSLKILQAKRGILGVVINSGTIWRAKNFGGDEGHNTIRWLNVGFYAKSHISIESGAVEHQPHDFAAYKSQQR